MMKTSRIKPKGQSAVEFCLIAPFLFFIFFAIIQLAYMSYVSFAVQRAALAVARDASLGGIDQTTAFKTKAALSLMPISNLSRKTLLTVLASQCSVAVSSDQKQIIAKVRYPMPIWVPLVGKVFGQTLIPSVNYNNNPAGDAIRNLFLILGKTPPDLSFQGVHLPVVWVTYQESTFNEAFKHWAP